jgi:hypothetical protein
MLLTEIEAGNEMKIAIYGATGMIGSAVVAEAVLRGHEVTGLSRRGGQPNAGESTASLRSVRGDASDPSSVRTIAAENDVVVVAAGPSREPGGDPRAFLDLVRVVMGEVASTRLVVVGGAGSLLAAPGTRLVDLPEFPEAYKVEALTQSEALDLLRAAGPELDWTYLSPAPEISSGAKTGIYKLGGDSPAGDRINTPDFAVALVDEIEHPAHHRERFTVAN